MLSWAKNPVVCLGLATFAFSVSCNSEQRSMDLKVSEGVSLRNIGAAQVDLECIKRNSVLFGELVKKNGLDPFRVRVFEEHPVVKEVTGNPCVQIEQLETTYFVSLEPKARVITRNKTGESFSYGYWAVKDGKFSFAECLAPD